MSTAWSWYVIVLTAINLIGICWLLFATARKPKIEVAPNASKGHVWDGDIEELDNPLPRWWLWLFILTIVFALGYLVFYPGLGNFAGKLGWTSQGEVERTLADTNAKLESLYAGFRDRSVADLSHDPAATKVGRNVFANNCASCHGSDARGAIGFPNLVDADWQYGGDPDTVLASIVGGRQGVMPPLGAALPDGGIDEVANHVLGLSGQAHDAALASAGKPKFEMLCAACHGVDGKGNPILGAPNLTDDIWLHGIGDIDMIRTTIVNGRNGVMPAWGPLLGEDRVRLAAAWVLSQGEKPDDSGDDDEEERDDDDARDAPAKPATAP